MSKITAIGIIPSMQDGTPILELRGIIKQVWPQEEKDGQRGKYKSQAFIASDGATGATTLVRMFDCPEIKPDQVGDMFRLTPRQDGSGVTKTSFKRTTGEKAGQIDHSIKVDKGASIIFKKVGEAHEQASVPDSGKAQQPAQQTRQRQASDPLTDAGNLMIECLHEASRVMIESPFDIEGGARELATTLFIEMRRSGINISMLPSRRGERMAPAPEATQESPATQPEPPAETEEQKQAIQAAPQPNRLTAAGLAAKAMSMPGSPELMRSLSVATPDDIVKAADFIMKDMVASGEATPDQLDAAFIEFKKTNNGADPNVTMVGNFKAFSDIVVKHAAPPPAEEVGIIEEEDEIISEIDAD